MDVDTLLHSLRSVEFLWHVAAILTSATFRDGSFRKAVMNRP